LAVKLAKEVVGWDWGGLGVGYESQLGRTKFPEHTSPLLSGAENALGYTESSVIAVIYLDVNVHKLPVFF
jgi:hypothetical protein